MRIHYNKMDANRYLSKFKDKRFLKKFFGLSALCLLCVAMQGLAIFYFMHFALWLRVLSIAILTFFAACAVLFGYLEKKELFRLTITGIIFAAVILTAYIILDIVGFFEKFTTFDSLKNFILSTGKWGKLIYVCLTVLQVVLIPIPSMITEVVASNLFGALNAFLLSVLGIIIGSIVAYLIGKIFGQKIVIWIVGKQKTEKYTKIFSQKGKYVFIIMMLLPFFPDDIICMAAGLSGMPFWYFLLVISLTRPVSSAVNTFFGSGDIIPFSGWGIPVWIAIFAILTSAFATTYFLKKRRSAQKLNAGRMLKNIRLAKSFEASEDDDIQAIITDPKIVNDKQVFQKLKNANDQKWRQQKK